MMFLKTQQACQYTSNIRKVLMDSCVSNLPGMEVETGKKRRQRKEREALDNFGDGDDADSRWGKNVRSKVSRHFTVKC